MNFSQQVKGKDLSFYTFLQVGAIFYSFAAAFWADLKYFKSNSCNIVNFGWGNWLILHKGAELVHHLNEGQIFYFTKFFAEIKAGWVTETADKWLCSIGVQQ
jgi:hypothetical protein